MSYKLIGSLCVCVFLLASCASPYQKARPFSGGTGYLEKHVTPILLRVEFRANAATTTEDAQNKALFRCAQIALENKKSYFFLFPTLNAVASKDAGSTPQVGRMDYYWVQAIAYIVLLDEKKEGALDAREILKISEI